MLVEIKENSVEKIGQFEYKYTTVNVEGTEVSVHAGPCDITVIVNNAAHKAWKGGGKCFADYAAAIANYKNTKIKTAIESAQDLQK